jgi:hypothetical protein
MATQFANGKTTTSGLVFMYDTTDKENCYKGEPTTNLVEYSEYQYLADNYTAALGGWDTFEGSFLIDAVNKAPGYTNRSIKMISVQANVYKYHFNVPLTSGQTYTVSFWGKATSAGNYGNFLLADGPSGYLVFEPGGYSSVTTEFTRFTYTFVVPSTGTYNFATYLYGDGQVVWLSGFQLENKSHATQYLPSNGAATTRSSTQGLKDLAGTNQIDISTVSFDANAQMTFDGTNDYVDLNNFPAFGTGPFTIELICKYDSYINGGCGPNAAFLTNWDSVGTRHVGIWAEYANLGFTLYYQNGFAIFGSMASLSGKWLHLTAVRNGDTLYAYLNGALINVSTNNSNASINVSSDAVLGYALCGVGTPTFNGSIPVCKAYNRALTQSEITQNYNAIKTRFNLA